MPCGDNRLNREQDYKDLQSLYHDMKKLLCSACRALERDNFDFAINPPLDKWWNNHKKEDLERQEYEAKREFKRKQAILASKKAIIDLTEEDKALLKEFKYI
jgi:hypothetical protein